MGNLIQTYIKLLNNLKKSVHVFHKPNAEGPLEIEQDFLTAIQESTEYAVNIAGYARISISDASMDYARYILKIAQNKFSKIVNIALKTASKNYDTSIQGNHFTNYYREIEKLLPNSVTQKPLKHSAETKDSKNTEYFADISALSHLHDVVYIGSVISMNNIDTFLGLLNNILKSYGEYVESCNGQQELLKSQIHGYIYAINQHMEYIKFFSKLCDQEILNYLNTLKQPIISCKEAVSKNLEKDIKSMVIIQKHTDPEYYKTALKYLELYNEEEWSIKTQAQIHLYLADLSELNEAIGHCIKSINLDKTLPSAYEKLGDLLFEAKSYKAAIDCYKVINNSFEIEKCYKKILEANPKNPQLTLDAADYFASIAVYSKAIKLYNHASSFSKDDNFKAITWNRISHVMENMQAKSIELAHKAEAHDFYNFDSIDMNTLQTLIMGDHFDDHS